ncbi:hypothetical protein OAF98_05005 [Planctomicrobium sp.]|mgnify:CR=1 FL=1|jgi:hypothetical protein|nr:hypothetical protein [Planctomicrobium sp.]MBT5017431.1 hypothetical protein [Planctomicrobium sp.]MDA7503566.1 hypothetical protein [bacterium]MDB4733070.1 hypothetical protein [Planctomicrobium sp.]MDB4743825.1 hypothetical protein [Planctomicrobium sp.]
MIYNELKSQIEGLGFFAVVENDAEIDGKNHRIVCANKRREGGGFTGCSFWVAERKTELYVGMWGGNIYWMPDESSICKLIDETLSAHTNTISDLSQNIIHDIELKLVENSDFDEIS